MSVNSLTHLSNTICYIDKPSPSKAEQAKLEAAQKAASTSADIALDASKKDAIDALEQPNNTGKTSDPWLTINGNGQTIGRIINTAA